MKKNLGILVVLGLIGLASLPTYGVIYDFNALSGSLSGQDGWTSSQGTITVTNGVAMAMGGVPKFSRTNDANWTLPTFTGNETEAVMQMDTQRVSLGTSTSNMQFMLNTNMGTGSGPTIMLQNNTSGAASFGVRQARSGIWATVLVPADVEVGDWVRLKLVMDLTANNGGGYGTLYYKNLTKGTDFAPTGITNLELNLNKVASPPANWNQIYLRCDGVTGYSVDNLVVLAGERVPVTGTVSLGSYGGSPQDAAVTVELRQNGVPVLTDRLLPGADGLITLNNIPVGLYDVAIKSYAHLSKVLPGVQIEAIPTVLAPVTLIGGDCDGDDEVTSTDLSIVLSNMDAQGE